MKFYIGPWENVTVEDGPRPFGWNPPANAQSLFDLRSNDWSRNENNGLFFADNDVQLGNDYERIVWQSQLPPQQSQRLLSRLGIQHRPTTTLTFKQVIRLALFRFSDPTGETTVRTPTPGKDGRLQIKTLAFAPQAIDTTTDSVSLQVLKNNYAKLRQKWIDKGSPNENRFHQKWLYITVRKLKLTGNQYRALQGGLPDEKPIDPTTTLSETLTGFTGNLDASAPFEYPSVSDYEGFTTGAGRRAIGGGWSHAAHTTSLSDDDHYSQIEWVATLGSAGPAIRCNDSTSSTLHDCYFTQRFSGQMYISKVVNGGVTNMANASAGGFSVGDEDKLEGVGSDLEGFRNGTSKVTTSDSALSGNLQAGFRLNQYASAALKNFLADDGAGGGGGVTYTQLESSNRGMNRGVYTA